MGGRFPQTVAESGFYPSTHVALPSVFMVNPEAKQLMNTAVAVCLERRVECAFW